jgi:hypothetical protein
MTIEARKLINQITRIESDALLKYLKDIFAQFADKQSEIVLQFAKPMRKQLKIEDLIKEQNYKGPNLERLEKIIDEIAIEEPIEDLLKMI